MVKVLIADSMETNFSNFKPFVRYGFTRATKL